MTFNDHSQSIIDSLITLTGDPFKTNKIMEQLSRNNDNFNIVKFVKENKVLKLIELHGNPTGVLKIKV